MTYPITLLIIFVMMLIGIIHHHYKNKPKKLMNEESLVAEDFCLIDIRDYISAHRFPYPGSENIPLSYLRREMKERFSCQKKILLITDDVRGAKVATKLIRKRQNQSVYYIKP